MKTKPKEIYIIFDPMDGPHLFTSEEQANKQMKQWAKEADNDYSDSFWDMKGPYKYILQKDKK